MFARLTSLFQLRRSTAFLLERQDDRLLEDIGLTRADLEDMRSGLAPAMTAATSRPRLIIRQQNC